MLFLVCRRNDYVEKLQIYNSSIFHFGEYNDWFPSERHYLLALHRKLPDFHSEQLELCFY
jgi:hypothetical protein